MTAVRQFSYGAKNNLAVTALQSLANSATVGWQSPRVDNTSDRAIDFEITFILPMANTAPANDRCWYPYICRWSKYDDATWSPDDQGTATYPSGTDSTTTIGTDGGNLAPGPALLYRTQQQIVKRTLLLSEIIGQTMPDGFSIILIDYTGAAASTGCVVSVRPITETIT